MYQILKNGKLLINAQDIETAMVYMRSLESNLDRWNVHSPYTIGYAPDTQPYTIKKVVDVEPQLNAS
jgi:hypothetical protein|tara:strand:+ start:272 stop:472 length:201 start_codon:yes stop_codon:yes gene_type:complete